jgi:hypothetical protein
MDCYFCKQTKYILLFLAIAGFLGLNSACFSSGAKKTQTKSTVLKPEITKPPQPPATIEKPEVIPPKETYTDKPKVTEAPVKIEVPEEVVPEKTVPVRSSSYKVAVMLPFSAGNYIPNAANDSVPEASILALEYYEGLLLSFEKLKQEGVSLQVQVYDTENNVATINQLLQNPELKSADLIVGPIYNRELKPVANFAQQNHIYHLSPLSPSAAVTISNPYYLMASPSIEAQCAAIYEHIAAKYGPKRIITICSNKTNETALSNLFFHFKHFNKETHEIQSQIPVSQIIYANQTATEIEQYLSATEDNMIVVTSFDPLIVYDLSSKLNTLRSKYRITLYGMPNWLNFEMVEFEYFANLNLHLPQPFWHDKNDPDYQAFRRSYLTNYKTIPSEYACRGYDLMLWLGRTLYQHGKSFGAYPNELNSKGIFTNFVFEPSSANQYTSGSVLNRTDFLENKFVNIVRYNPDFSFEKVNK